MGEWHEAFFLGIEWVSIGWQTLDATQTISFPRNSWASPPCRELAALDSSVHLNKCRSFPGNDCDANFTWIHAILNGLLGIEALYLNTEVSESKISTLSTPAFSIQTFYFFNRYAYNNISFAVTSTVSAQMSFIGTPTRTDFLSRHAYNNWSSSLIFPF